jgi:dihydropteroate synthase
MGILNVTPDSFSDGGKFLDRDAAVDRAWQIAEEGADILDIGGESSRPGSEPVGAREELRRVLPVLEALGETYPIPISIDTSEGAVAAAVLERGASLVNDIYALARSPGIAHEVAKTGAGLILMHMRGRPRTMRTLPPSHDILEEIEAWIPEAIARARGGGVSCDKIILDPGIGFGKTVAQNLEILRNLGRLARAGYPLMVGTSRKSFLGAITQRPAQEREWGTAASVVAAILHGVHVVRVHDVAAMRDVVRVADALLDEGSSEWQASSTRC